VWAELAYAIALAWQPFGMAALWSLSGNN